MCLWSLFSSQCRIEKTISSRVAGIRPPPPLTVRYPGCLNKTCSAEKRKKKLQYSAWLASTPPVFRIHISWVSKFLGPKSLRGGGEQATVWDWQRIIINQAGTRLFFLFFGPRPCEALGCFKVLGKAKWQIQTVLIYVQIWQEKKSSTWKKLNFRWMELGVVQLCGYLYTGGEVSGRAESFF